VIALRDLDAAAASFSRLGFTLTPRGVHSIGSQNHCIMFGSTYIELLAAPVAHPWLDYYRRFLERGDGLAALALATEDAADTYSKLRQQGVAARPPMDLSRPLAGGGVARFRLVQIDNAPQVFICQHLTRELVWQPQWQQHENGARELVRASLPAEKPFDAVPAATEWAARALLALKGLQKPTEVHGVRLEPA